MNLFRLKLCLIAALLLFGGGQLSAQPAAPIRHMYNVGDDEFYLGGTIACRPTAGHIDSLWLFLRSMNLNIMSISARYGADTIITPLVTSPFRVSDTTTPAWNRMVLYIDPLTDAAHSNALDFFPFDSVQSQEFQCRFTGRAGGTTHLNASETDPEFKRPVNERVYSTDDSTTVGQMIASNIVYDQRPKEVYRYPWSGTYNHSAVAPFDSVQNTTAWINERRNTDPITYLAVKGHLFSALNNNVANDSAILKVEIWHEIPKDEYYVADTLAAATNATSNQERLFKTLYVTKGDLMPPSSDQTNARFNKYRQRVFKIDLRREGNIPGPLFTTDLSHHFDIRVYWLGGEKVALRSIGLRDYTASLLYGDDSAANAFKARIIRNARFALTGDTLPASSFRNPVIMMEGGFESFALEDGGGAALARMIRDTFNVARPSPRPRDTVGVYNFGVGRRFQQLTDAPMVVAEVLQDHFYDTSITQPGYVNTKAQFGIPHFNIPSIRQHNGARDFHTPLLEITPQGVADYTTTFQRLIVGRYGTDLDDFPNNIGWTVGLGLSANNFRATGARMLTMPGNNCWIWIRRINGKLDTTIGHIPEGSELRMNVNMELCYGSRGIDWFWLGSISRMLNTLDSVGVQDSFGSNGDSPGDTTQNVMDYVLSDGDSWVAYNSPVPHDQYGHYPGGSIKITIPQMYVGWRDRTREMRRINERLARLGPIMARLRWRDSYSVNGQAPMPGTPDIDTAHHATRPRPLSPDEIITAVTARSRTGAVDSAYATYVELGLFDKHAHADTNKHVLDTNYVFVVNRRTFERPEGITASGADSLEALTMDSLAETRTISLTLNMQHPDPLAWNYIHVREVLPDTTALPLTTAPRQGLDTIVFGDRNVELTLRPGGAALLEMTYWQPGQNVAGGNIRFNNQRKIIGDSNRYYAVYFHKVKYFWPFQDMPGQPKKKLPRFEDQVFIRRSLPMVDTIRGIQWEPYEYMVSDTTADTCVRENRYPSIAERIVGSDTVITVVWNGYGNDGRVIWMKNIRYKDTLAPDPSQLVHVGTHSYAWSLDTLWGTPVVSHLHGGDMIAWSDTLAGIVSRFRSVGSGLNWWKEFKPGVSYSRFDTVSKPFTVSYGPGMYPSMPPFAHIAGKDSNIAIVWQQPTALNRIAIKYIRMVDTVQAGTHTIRNVLPYLTVSHNQDSINLHPSIDMTQDVWLGAQEAVTWESFDQPFTSPAKTTRQTTVHVSSLWTTTHHLAPNYSPEYDSIGVTSQWTYNTFIAAQPYAMTPPSFKYVYPSISSINARFDTQHQNDLITFALALAPVTTGNDQHPMRQTMVQYAVHDPLLPLDYLDLGTATFDPNGAGSMKKQSNRHAVLYVENPLTSPIVLNSSRQFYAMKGARPSGYAAKGRQLYLRIDDSLNTGMTAMLHDVWIAGTGSGQGLAMTARPERLRVTDSLDEVRELFRTAYFRAHDSTTIGWTMKGRFIGDSAIAAGMSATFVTEVIDSATERVVATIDSFQTAPGIAPYWSERDSTLDLLSGTYYVRMRIETEGLPTATVEGDSRYPVEEVASFVPGVRLGKVERIDAVTGATGRLSVHPNPTSGTAEILFSVPEQGPVSVTLYDALGRRIAEPMEGRITEAGRYGIDIDGGTLAPGTYVIEFRYGEHRLVEKLVVVR